MEFLDGDLAASVERMSLWIVAAGAVVLAPLDEYGEAESRPVDYGAGGSAGDPHT